MEFLNSLANYERISFVQYNTNNFSLNRISRILRSLGNPQKNFKSVHIAGTKGKGSTVAMLAAMLRACGYRVGSYTSPHVISMLERISIDGQPIEEPVFVKMLSEVAAAIERSRVSRPSYFEVMTATAFKAFERLGMDVAVVEVGLGGRLDCTNVIMPEAVGITSISLDHQRQLGHTKVEIAREKAGTFKPGVPVVSAQQDADVKKVFREIAASVGAPIRFSGDEIEFSYRFEASRGLGRHTRLCVSTGQSKFEHLHVPLLGEHQAVNCGVALGLMDALKSRGFAVDDRAAIEGLANVRLMGRMEVINESPRILVDAAHNASSIEALMRAIGQNMICDSMVVIFGCQKDKDIPGMINRLQLGADKIIFTRTPSPRTADPQELAAEYAQQSGRNPQVAENLDDAISIALRAISREDLICVTGSFYLVGEAKLKYSADVFTR